MLPLSWIVSALLLSSTQAAFQCFLDRNGYSCANQGSVYKEFMCVSKENSMSDIMACVKPIDLKNDVQLCRDVSATSGDLDVNLYDGLPNRYCLEPRDVLEFQSTKPQLCNGCKLRGAILACPKQDKAFANCICSHSGPIQKAVNCLSTCFKNVPEDFLSCTNRPVTSLGQRDSPRNEIEAESPSKRDPQSDPRGPSANDLNGLSDETFYYDQYYSAVYFKRCYVDPEEPKATCRYLLMSKYYPSARPAGVPTGATYDEYEEDPKPSSTGSIPGATSASNSSSTSTSTSAGPTSIFTTNTSQGASPTGNAGSRGPSGSWILSGGSFSLFGIIMGMIMV